MELLLRKARPNTKQSQTNPDIPNDLFRLSRDGGASSDRWMMHIRPINNYSSGALLTVFATKSTDLERSLMAVLFQVVATTFSFPIGNT